MSHIYTVVCQSQPLDNLPGYTITRIAATTTADSETEKEALIRDFPEVTECVYNCIITHTPFPLFQVASLFPIAPATRPLSEHQESGQSDHGAPKCTHQSNPGLIGHVRAPVRLNQNRNDRTVRAGAAAPS